MTITLNVTKRESAEALKTVRADGMIPAVFYGGGSDATLLKINEGELIKAYKSAGESSVIDLGGDMKGEQAIIQEIQTEPKSGKVLHLDLFKIEAGKPVNVTVPLEFVGKSLAEINGVGVITKIIQEIEIEVLPKEMPNEIQVDISKLADFSDAIYVKDLDLPASAKPVADADDAVATVSGIKEEVEEAEGAGEIDFDSIAVQEKGKKEETESTDSE
ncbi:MAG: 50S ribosomal protein L25 [Candidatus Nomurabacteria bacterium]|nr:50S ribosomal protein L25 [Candidatus Nomurabacteria bacterium]